MGGAKSPDSISGPLLRELAGVISDSTVVILPGLGHLAPEDHPDRVATTLVAQAHTRRPREDEPGN